MEVDPLLIVADQAGHRPSLEVRVAQQWRSSPNSLAGRSGFQRDDTILSWAQKEAERFSEPRVLDIGCAFGNHLLMLIDRLGQPAGGAFVGTDLATEKLAFGNAFASSVPGYSNARFERGDIEEQLPFESQSFDVVMLNDVFEHLEDPAKALGEIRRVLTPTGALIISTPQRTTLFKRLSHLADRASGGRISARYYAGKATELDELGKPVMVVDDGHEHISEMTLAELRECLENCGFEVENVELMTVMSGSTWFDKHPTLMAGLLLVEAAHLKLRRPSWAHGVCVFARPRTS